MEIMEKRALQYGIGEVIFKDAEQSLETELAAVDELIESGVDALIVTPVADPGVGAVVEKASQAGIPLVLEATALLPSSST